MILRLELVRPALSEENFSVQEPGLLILDYSLSELFLRVLAKPWELSASSILNPGLVQIELFRFTRGQVSR